MINLKDKKISNIFLGNKKITNIFKGNRLMYSSGLPSDYQEVLYVQSSGTQFIDTNFIGSNKTSVEIKFRITTMYGALQLLGTLETGKNITLNVGNSETASNRWGTSTKNGTFGLSTNVTYTAKISEDGYIIGNNNIWTPEKSEFNCSKTFYLFTTNSSTYRFYGRIYYCKIYDNGTLVRSFIPCYRKSDNEIGLYDIVNHVFYTNAGTGTFTKGGDV